MLWWGRSLLEAVLAGFTSSPGASVSIPRSHSARGTAAPIAADPCTAPACNKGAQSQTQARERTLLFPAAPIRLFPRPLGRTLQVLFPQRALVLWGFPTRQCRSISHTSDSFPYKDPLNQLKWSKGSLWLQVSGETCRCEPTECPNFTHQIHRVRYLSFGLIPPTTPPQPHQQTRATLEAFERNSSKSELSK